MIRFPCPWCKKILSAPDESAGKTAQCADCNTLAKIPTSSTVVSSHGIELVPMDDAIQVKRNPAQRPPAPMPPTPSLVPGPSLAFRCPHCHSLQEIGMEFAGQVVNCPKCNLPFQIPVPQAQTAWSEPISQPALAQSRNAFELPSDEPIIASRSRRRGRGNGVLALVLGIMGLLVCPGFGLVALIVARSALKDDEDDGCAKAGYVLGFITGLPFLALMIVLVIMLAYSMTGTFWR
jgi:hypothetical protein